MIVELSVSNLGVIDSLALPIPTGMIALTGETGAGKTLLVDAIWLLVGGRADPGLVRPGADEARVDGRFIINGQETVISRVVPAEGRSRAYIDGRPVTAAHLGELGEVLVDLHGQHSHQSLLGVQAQRQALDTFAGVDLSDLVRLNDELDEVDRRLGEMGGDERSRARELDLVRYQVDELDGAGLDNPDEEEELARTEELLANAVDHQETAQRALVALADDDGARDLLAAALHDLAGESPFADVAERLGSVMADIDDVIDQLRSVADTIEPDPEELARIQERQRLLRDLRRKYGDSLAEVMAEADQLRQRLAELEGFDQRAAELDAERNRILADLAQAKAEVRDERRAGAPNLAEAIQSRLRELAMPNARIGIEVDGDDGSEVSFQLSANPGLPLQALSKVASGGELARTMLALRSVLSEAPPILVFDEVDAGIGGQAGFAVGRNLSNLGDRHQVLVVTHLPQVAAFADTHLAVEKTQGDDSTVSVIRALDDEERLAELARMLSGQPDSSTARQHAKELIAEAGEARRRGQG